MRPVQLFCWHFMAYPYLPADFDEKYDSGRVTVPNSLWDSERSRGLFMMAQPERGASHAGLREMLFESPGNPSD